jgi:pimeloyl-ACP methyl ester carboxylesterase
MRRRGPSWQTASSIRLRQGSKFILTDNEVKTMQETQPDNTRAPLVPAPTATVKVSDTDELDVWAVGEGTPVVLVHGAYFWYLLKPLAEELAKKGHCQAIWYARRGYNGKPTKPVDVPEQARDVVKILDQLEIRKAHVIGHSAGAVWTLALAMEAPDRPLSVALLDFMLPNQIESGKMIREAAGPLIAKVQAGDIEGAAEDQLSMLGVSHDFMDQILPGSWPAMVKDARTWFQFDLPALDQWTAGPEKVKAIEVPIANLRVSDAPPFRETNELMQKWIPDLTVLELSTDHHFFPVTATAETAAVLDSWVRGQGAAD